MNRLNADKAHKHLLKVSEKLPISFRKLLESNGHVEITDNQNEDLFEKLAKTIVSQQLSTLAARSIWTSIEKLRSEADSQLIEFVLREGINGLHSCGLSRAKSRAISETASAINKGVISESALVGEHPDIIIDTLISIWGIGKWTAEMVSISYFGLPDIWSASDTSLNRGIKALSHNDSITERLIIEASRPYRSYLAKHIWVGLDTKML